ncbi:MAG: hypothetical protein ACJA1A_003267 [Saprospiraceae bacterium]|jgi:hypothetical protein
MNATPIESPVEPTFDDVPVSINSDPNLHIVSYCEQMFDYAISKGLAMPKEMQFDFKSVDKATLLENHNQLSTLIAPASLRSISFIQRYIFDEEKMKKWWNIPIYSKCFYLSLTALLAVIVISLSPIVNNANLSKGLLDSSGIDLLFNLIFICSSAMLGVMFYSLKSINDKIKTYTLTPIDVLELNSNILIGVISGFIISELFTVVLAQFGDYMEITKMTLAILGGFSADAIFSILQGIVNKLKMLLAPSF